MDIRIEEKFFGTILDSSFEKVILTNIQPFYDSISKKARLISKSKGFYENKKIIINNTVYRLIKITPGNTIIDILEILKKVSREIILIGLVGGLSNNLKLGDIVEPRIALTADEKSFKLNRNGVGKIFQTNGLVNKMSFYKQLKKNGVDFVDMESFYLGSFGKKNKNIYCHLIGLVSDLPVESPFYLDKNINFSAQINNIIKYI